MDLVTIGSKNQIVIPKAVREKIKALKPGRKVKIYSLNHNTLIIKADTQSWLEGSYGSMKRAWSKEDPLNTLEESRNQW